MSAVSKSLTVAVPQLGAYQPQTGIGRVFSSVRAFWGDEVRLVDAHLVVSHLPILRNFPTGVSAPAGTDLVFLPRLTGAQALRATGGLPSVVVVHDVGIVDCPWDREDMDWLTYRSIVQSFRGLRAATVIIAVSSFTRARLIRYLPDLEPRVVVVPNGVMPHFLQYNATRVMARERLSTYAGCMLGEPLVISVGSELARKNIPMLLSVLRRLKDHYPGAQLLKIGPAGHPRRRAATLANIRDLGLVIGRDVLILERVDDEILATAYRAADVFVSASLYEGFGLPALEALAVGTPVVVTDRGAFPEVVGAVGRVVRPDPDELAWAVDEALCQLDLAAWAKQARAHAATFSLTETAAWYLEIMRSVAAGDGRLLVRPGVSRSFA